MSDKEIVDEETFQKSLRNVQIYLINENKLATALAITQMVEEATKNQ